MANRNADSVYLTPSLGKTVFIDTNLGTHLATLLHQGDTVSSFKKKLLDEHRICFPDAGEIEISALKVKRRGQFYHLSDTMFVTKAFDGISKSWFLFLEARKVVKEGENRQLQCIDSSKQVKYLTNGVEPLLDDPARRRSGIDELSHQLESDHRRVKSKPSGYLSGADKQQPTDFHMEAERSAGNHPDVDYPDTHAVENVVVDLQKVSAANHNSSDPKLLEKGKDIATSSEFVDGSTRNEVMDVKQNPNLEEAARTELATITKRTRKSKRKTRSSDDHALEGNHGPSGASALTSATNAGENAETNADKVSANVDGSGNIKFEHHESAALVATEPSVIVRENADVQDNSIEAEGDVIQHKINENVVENAKSVKETSSLQTPARKRRKIEKRPRREDSVAGSVESMFNTNKAITKPGALRPQPSLEDRPKVSNLDAAEIANHLEAISGLTGSPTADKKKKRKKSSKDHTKSAAATTYSRDLVNGSHGVPGKVDRADVGVESCAISPREKLDDPRTAAIEKETEMGEKNVDNAFGTAMLSAANNLQTADFATTPLPLVQKFKKPDLIGNDTDQNVGHKDKKRTPMHEVANLGTFSTKRSSEAMANTDDGELNADEAKAAKSSKGKRKSKKAKTPVEDTLFISGAQHVESSGIGISSTEPVKSVDGDGPDSVIRNVLESLQQSKENEENLEKIEKKSRKKTKKKQPLNLVDGQGLTVQENNAAEEEAPMVSINDLKEMVDSSKPLKKDKLGKTSAVRQSSRTILEFENDTGIESSDPFVSKKNTEIVDLAEDTNVHKLNGNGEGNPSNQSELCHEKEKADIGDNFGCPPTEDDMVARVKKHDEVGNGTRAAEPGAKSNKKKKITDLHPGGSMDGSRSSMKPNEKQGSSRRAQPASSSTSQLPSKVKNGSAVSLRNKDLQSLGTGANDDASHKLEKNSKALIPDTTNASAVLPNSKKMKEARVANVSESIQPNTADRHGSNVDQSHASVKVTANKKEVVKGSSGYMNKNNPKDREKNVFPTSGKIFKDGENSNSEEGESKISGASTRTPSDASSDYSDEDSDATFMSQKPGSHVFGGEGGGETNASLGRKDMSLERILRSSSRFKKAKLTASQSQPDSYDNESLPFDCVPDSQAN